MLNTLSAQKQMGQIMKFNLFLQQIRENGCLWEWVEGRLGWKTMRTLTSWVVFDLFHRERHKADMTKRSLVPFVHDGYTGVFTYIFCKFILKKNKGIL